MLLSHICPTVVLPRIRLRGLLPFYAETQARMKAVWYCSAKQVPWAIVHCMRKHQTSLEATSVLQVRVPRAGLVRFRSGLWWSAAELPPGRILRVVPALEYGQNARGNVGPYTAKNRRSVPKDTS